MNSQGSSRPTGQVGLKVIRGARPSPDLSFEEVLRYGTPQRGLPDRVNDFRLRNLRNLKRRAIKVAAARVAGLQVVYGNLWLRHRTAWGDEFDLGLVSQGVVTTAFVNRLVDEMQALGSSTVTAFKFHAIGTGTGNEASSDTALGTELTTEYTGDVRATGSQTEGAGANVYRTVGTVTIDSGTPAITEHGVFNAATVGVLLDRSKFAAINLVAADSIEATYDFTATAGG